MNYTRSPFSLVCDFQKHILGNDKPVIPAPLSDSNNRHHIACLQEELNELKTALEQNDLVGVADALADLIYFAYGYAYKMGLPMEAIFEVVHNANMTKVRGFTHRGRKDDAAKPPGWQPPETRIQEIIYGKT